jgi:pilus assembly protein Flp/PilA
MISMKKALVALWREEDGLTMVEYAIAGGLVAAVGVTVFTNLGQGVSNIISLLGSIVDNAYSTATGG